MFNLKKDRVIVEIKIEFNITAINEWLKSGAKFEDIDKIKREEYGVWKDSVVQRYDIDMIPIGKNSDAYFHRKKGIISQNIGGVVDFLENIEDDFNDIFEKESEISELEWSLWNGCLGLSVNRNLILLTPVLSDVVELSINGKLSNHGHILDDDKKIKVQVSFDDDKKAKEFMDIYTRSGYKFIKYENGLSRVSFSAVNDSVFY